MSDTLLFVHQAALGAMKRKPRPLARALEFAAEDFDFVPDLSESVLRQRLFEARAGDELSLLWRHILAEWDFASEATWTDAPPRTLERRSHTYKLLDVEPRTAEVLDAIAPVAVEDGPTVISDEFSPWYDARREGWYWPAYRGLLLNKGWKPEAVASLDDATTKVVERLANPSQPEAYQSKGLVVGYVQSGKTANFTGVVAKAMDAGYRLIIVLGGTLNLLRGQTQRRLDMELVGEENILRGRDRNDPEALEDLDYGDDPEWHQGKFLKHGGLPSLLHHFDIERLTTRDYDYKRLQQGISALEFEKKYPHKPLFHSDNLHASKARLMVVKKNKIVLEKLLKDLRKIHTPLDQIPVLIIDDESDQASVNTSNPKKWQEGKAERTAINGLIAQLLAQLPRAQYVGYTATPFANVFIDPSDAVDIFPKDFIISLQRPDGYMGVRDFHDLDSDVPPEERAIANSQEAAHVRGITVGDESDDVFLQQALDMYVLTGAVKLFREQHGLGNDYFRHHTMLVHQSVRVAEHRELSKRLTKMWYESAYMGEAGHQRLRALFASDLKPVSTHHAAGQAVPDTFDELIPCLGPVLVRISGDGGPVITVNGDQDVEKGAADFDKRSIWKILVGGTKLSRGFTVEGLTVTYYRRTTAQADTLMQMGRWFGFRRGYRDLVRLFIGRSEAFGRQTVDLYDAFEAICRDEEAFREELHKYAELVDGKPQVTPAQVPPLVAQHLPWLKPTGANKMYNAELVVVRSPGRRVEPTGYPLKAADLKHNTALWRPLLDLLAPEAAEFFYKPNYVGERPRHYHAFYGAVGHQQLLAVMSDLRWWDPTTFSPHLAYLEELGETPGQVDDWVLLLPGQSAQGRTEASILGARPLPLARRNRRRYPLFGAIMNPEHRQAAYRIAGAPESVGDESADRLARPRRGAVVLYPIVEQDPAELVVAGTIDPTKVVMGFALIPPVVAQGAGRELVRFRTRDSSRPNVPIIDHFVEPS
ncbi:Z1 domain-containing protein [Yinghuangia sp. YIM S09857]|uniref:Z1 domain-containing protein n=1 Tax=Yinghuangia sp. YIM S09857 TaxID=3436929 RepID=UPI003F53DA86